MKKAKEEIRQWETRNDSLSPFERARQYEVGDIDYIINRWRGVNIQSAKPMSKSFNPEYQVMSPSTFNSLIKMVLTRPSATAEMIMTDALQPDQLKRALPSCLLYTSDAADE